MKLEVGGRYLNIQNSNFNFIKKENKMNKIVEVHFLDIEENKDYLELINKVMKMAFKEEKLDNKNVYINIILTDPKNIKNTNKRYRNIDKETDVLSFPMFEKDEIVKLKKNKSKIPEVLGDIMISTQRVMKQAEEYGHSFERELSYMLVHGFYHIIGYDHIEEEDKVKMREKEENILEKLSIIR